MKLFNANVDSRVVGAKASLRKSKFWTRTGVTQIVGPAYESAWLMLKRVRERMQLVDVEKLDRSPSKRQESEVVEYLERSHPSMCKNPAQGDENPPRVTAPCDCGACRAVGRRGDRARDDRDQAPSPRLERVVRRITHSPPTRHFETWLTELAAVAMLIASVPATAAPVLTTVDCDGSGVYTCLTRIEDFAVGATRYDADFVEANVLDAFGVDTSGGITLSLFDPLKTAIFWGDVAGAQAFAGALAGLLQDEGIDGFLCGSVGCAPPGSASYGVTYIPVYLQATAALPVVEIASCFAGTNAAGAGFSFCGYNPGSNNQNWAVITAVPESDVATLVLAAASSMSLTALVWGWGSRVRRGRHRREHG